MKKGTFESLSLEEKSKLTLRNVQLFDESLKEAVQKELEQLQYPSETLSLSASTGGIQDSSTSDALKEVIEKTRERFGLSHLKYFDLITTTDSNEPKYELVKDEYDNALDVQDYYMKLFLKSLLEKMSHQEYSIEQIDPNNKRFLEQVIAQIKVYGIDNYKTFVDQYNASLLEQRKNNMLKTPQEIVENNCKKHL